jgi:hypothetical protein
LGAEPTGIGETEYLPRHPTVVAVMTRLAVEGDNVFEDLLARTGCVHQYETLVWAHVLGETEFHRME